MKGYLLLEDGMQFEGTLFGSLHSPLGEVVFNTGMTGYQETLTDPSYYGQIVVMTYPLIGNYGFNAEDSQHVKPMVEGFIIREGCDSFSNWRGSESMEDYFLRHGLTGLMDVDTRALTRHLREAGTLRGKILRADEVDDGAHNEIIREIKTFDNSKGVWAVTTKKDYIIHPMPQRVAVIDFGIKENILRSLSARNMLLHVFPAGTTAKEILNSSPDGIFLSNGPGDPGELPSIIEEIKILANHSPIFGICLGHQLLAHALGAETRKMKYGHRGSNHPVKDIRMNRVYITSQNHGYEVLEESLAKDVMEVSHYHVNDGTIEGIRHKTLPIFSVQFHPEACPGPADTAHLFDQFSKMMADWKGKIE